jgi:hypothetical protein
MRKPTYLSFDELIKFISKEFLQIPEHRAAAKVKYELNDCLMSGLAMMFFQHPSLLQYQEKMKQGRGRSNLERLFNTSSVPSDTQMREILDGVQVAGVRVILKKIFERTRRYGVASAHWAIESDYLVVLDATQYFSSEAIQCPSCLRRTNKKGETVYCHQVLPATIVKPGTHQILPLDVEEICNSDGAEKQDCEVNAAKRLINRLRKEHAKLQMTIGGDDIYSREPMINELRANRYNFILVAKPTSHKEMFSEIEQLTKTGGVETGEYEESKGNKILVTRYRIGRQVPLNGAGKCIVNFFEIWQEDKASGKQLYHNSWVTNLDITRQNIARLANKGRARWKVENEGFNVQKNGGYELEHNYGHGQNNLSMVFYLLNILAFTLHQILEITDLCYQRAKEHAGGLRYIWEDLRSLMKRWPLSSWTRMLEISMEKEPVFDQL